MITNDLFKRILIEPIQRGINKLLIVSGYATSAMAFHHLTELKRLGNTNVEIKLIIGMCSSEGISLNNHNGFKQIMNESDGRFQCSYRISNPPTHSKVYVWLANDNPRISFLGSPNYTQTAFNEKLQKEALAICDNNDALSYFESMVGDSIYCNHPEPESMVQIFNDKIFQRQPKNIAIASSATKNSIFQPNFESLEQISVSLLDKYGNVQHRGGLNWGQRPSRNPNQAYIQLSPKVYNSDFFPIKKIHFTVLTDDNKTLICTRAQKNVTGATIETPHNNSLLGEYFRNRLGLANGAYITYEDLIRYGRTDVTFIKIDDENYYMDFSVP